MSIKIGILGAGSISDTHARAALAIPGVEIAAVYGRNVAKAQRLAELYGGVAFDSLERFLEHRPMDLVAIGSPSALHAEQGIAAAERGLHVLVEKPLDITDRQGRRLDCRSRSRRREAGRLLSGPSQTRRGQDEGDGGRRRRWTADPRVRAGQVVPPAGILRRLPLARHVCARRRRRPHQSSDTHRRPAPPSLGADRQRRRARRHPAPQDRGRGHGRGHAAVRERGAWASSKRRPPSFPATRAASS